MRFAGENALTIDGWDGCPARLHARTHARTHARARARARARAHTHTRHQGAKGLGWAPPPSPPPSPPPPPPPPLWIRCGLALEGGARREEPGGPGRGGGFASGGVPGVRGGMGHRVTKTATTMTTTIVAVVGIGIVAVIILLLGTTWCPKGGAAQAALVDSP